MATFASYDKFSPSYKSVWMMRNIIHFYNLANQAIDRAAGVDGSDGYLHSHQTSLGRSFLPLSKFEDPAEGEDTLVAKFKKL